MADDDDEWANYPPQRQSRLQLVDDDRPFALRPARLPDPKTIPPRRWIYGTQLIRGYVSCLVAPGGTGKSLYALGVGMSCALGSPLFRHAHVHARCNVAMLNLEDPEDELERRTAAMILRHNIDETELRGRLFVHTGEERRITMAALADDHFSVWHPDERPLVVELKARDIGLLIVDPYAESHTLEENSNPQMIAASMAWRRVARRTGCAVLLVHHVRKGQALDIDAARGAKALTDSARVGLLMSAMSAEEAEELGIDAEDRYQYVRLDNAKANLAPRAGAAVWFHLDQVELENCTQDYPSGDNVAALVSWETPAAWGGLTTEQCNAALDRIAEGPGDGVLYTASNRGRANERWAGSVLLALGLSEKQATRLISEWLKNGVLVSGTYRDPTQRKDRTCVRVIDARRPGCTFDT